MFVCVCVFPWTVIDLKCTYHVVVDVVVVNGVDVTCSKFLKSIFALHVYTIFHSLSLGSCVACM